MPLAPLPLRLRQSNATKARLFGGYGPLLRVVSHILVYHERYIPESSDSRKKYILVVYTALQHPLLHPWPLSREPSRQDIPVAADHDKFAPDAEQGGERGEDKREDEGGHSFLFFGPLPVCDFSHAGR